MFPPRCEIEFGSNLYQTYIRNCPEFAFMSDKFFYERRCKKCKGPRTMDAAQKYI